MATLYFNSTTIGGANDGDWSNPVNWWMDDTFLIPAGTTPNPSNDVEIRSDVILDTDSLASSPGVGEATFRDAIFDANVNGLTLISINNNIQFYGVGRNAGTLVTSGGFVCAFHDRSFNEVEVLGNATFNDYSSNGGGLVTGDATFNDYSSDGGGIITGDATFNDYSFNGYHSTVSGNATFNDSSHNDYGTVSGNATFNDYSSNYDTVSGDATFNDYSYNEGGTVAGDAIFNDYSYNGYPGVVVGDAAFNDNSSNNAFVYANATFNNYSTNYSTVYGDGIFNDDSTNFEGSSANATYNDNSFNSDSLCSGVVTMNGPFNNGRIFSYGNLSWGTFINNMTFPTPVKKAISISQLLNLPFPIEA